MHDNYIPGTGRFWIYLAIALPLVIVVSAIIVFVNSAYDEAGNWSWLSLRSNLSCKAEQNDESGMQILKQEHQLPEAGRAL